MLLMVIEYDDNLTNYYIILIFTHHTMLCQQQIVAMDIELLKILACPKCRGDLEEIPSILSDAGLFCRTCDKVYPIRDDIPVLLISEGVTRNQWK